MIASPENCAWMLPSWMESRDNSRKIRHYKIAVRQALDHCLTPRQREQIQLHYQQGLTKTQIAHQLGTGCSAVCKSVKAAELAIQAYVEQYMQIYDALEREMLQDLF